MSKEKLTSVDEVNIPEDGTLCAKIIKIDGEYHVTELDGTDCGSCKFVDDGRTLALPKNSSNRQYFNVAKADADIEANGSVDLTYKANKHFGPVGNKLPNEKLIAYLPEDLQAEYKEIVERAKAARDAAKAQPMSDKEKLEAKIAKLKAQLESLN